MKAEKERITEKQKYDLMAYLDKLKHEHGGQLWGVVPLIKQWCMSNCIQCSVYDARELLRMWQSMNREA